MPFRLDEIPFFDTTFLCELAQPTHFTSYEEEVEPWDAPLRRRNNISTHISAHMHGGHRRESHYSEIGSDDGMLVNEPFSRDPNMPMTKIKARRFDNSPRPSIAPTVLEPHPYSYSPTPYSKPSIGNLREKFSSDADSKIFKKRSAPKPPGMEGYSDQLEQRRESVKKGPAPPRPVSPYGAPKTDAIREMESIGRKEVCESFIWDLKFMGNLSGIAKHGRSAVQFPGNVAQDQIPAQLDEAQRRLENVVA